MGKELKPKRGRPALNKHCANVRICFNTKEGLAILWLMTPEQRGAAITKGILNEYTDKQP
jgi:hypothetical protein